MAEYIEREATIRALQPTHAPAINEVLASVIRRVPAADVVAVVRCGECIRKNICWIVSGDDNWYCADGKRRDGGQDDV